MNKLFLRFTLSAFCTFFLYEIHRSDTNELMNQWTNYFYVLRFTFYALLLHEPLHFIGGLRGVIGWTIARRSGVSRASNSSEGT